MPAYVTFPQDVPSPDRPGIPLPWGAGRLALPIARLSSAEMRWTVHSDEQAALVGRDTGQLAQAVLDVPLAVVRLVRDTGDEVVDVGGGVEVRRADLAELVEDAVAQLPPVLAQLLLHLAPLLLDLALLLLLDHFLWIPFSVVVFLTRLKARSERYPSCFGWR
ncbi:hypothetical protein FRAHR75_80137 [Frankia sp. Hr75.2]|nr:hypothetical protein FRAHR75_80137 [Frankia sp. Hr75.2]SQD94324.1 hypothetical protein FMEAI12_2470007 [Parafrankia sp. Ea1.12]